MDTNKTLLRTDNVFLTLSQNGKNILSIYRGDFGCIADILKYVYEIATGCFGIANLCVRNQNQGWKFNVPLMFSAHKITKMSVPRRNKKAKYIQQELPFSWQ